MAITSVLDPRCKFQMINACFPLIFKIEEVSIANMNKIRTLLQQLYCEYSLNMEVTSSNKDSNTATKASSSQKPKQPPMKSELDAYLDEHVFIPTNILAIPISTVTSKSTFSAEGRVINEYSSKLNGESTEALICGGDWLRSKYLVNKKKRSMRLKKIKRKFT
ncbi:hypothetical protein Lal_00025769 [Lupinus albus]|nr:hypothetical protein Lal_00025769 [Lupinus albus]